MSDGYAAGYKKTILINTMPYIQKIGSWTNNIDDLYNSAPTVLFRHIRHNPLEIRSYVFETELLNKAKIKERLEFLDGELDGTENKERYRETKALLVQILGALEYEKYPFIGVDDDGQIGAEWHDGADYKIVSITPVSGEKVIINCIKKSPGAAIRVQTTLENILKNANKELMITI